MRHVSEGLSAILDANVLYPFLVRDVLLSLADAGLYRPLWTGRINEEWVHHLMKRMPGKEEKIRATVAIMNEAFPEAVVENYESLIPMLELPDPDDRHVLAAAVRGGANVVVTENIADFPVEALERYDLEARTADEFILSILERYPGDVVASLKRMRARYENPPLSQDELLQSMLRCGLVMTVATLAPQAGAL